MLRDPGSRGPPSGPHQGFYPIKCLPQLDWFKFVKRIFDLILVAIN